MNRTGNKAIVLAAGKGRRMNADLPKQYIEVCGKPVLYYTLRVFENSPEVDEIILVTGPGDEAYCDKMFREIYGFRKITKITAGASERSGSVLNGLRATDPCEFVLIHDGARPFVDEEIIRRNLETVRREGSAVTGMPVKDTIRICDADGKEVSTPDRSVTWMVQTPQTFPYDLIRNAYEAMAIAGNTEGITDDAMVASRFGGIRVAMTEGSYRNIKITSPEDLEWMAMYIKGGRENA